MKLIIVGCGRLGSALALSTARAGHEVTVVDRSAQAFDRLGADFHGRTIQGEVLHQEVLRRAGIEEADGLAVVTPDDHVNLVVARIAVLRYGVPNVVARVYDLRHRPLFEELGVQTVASALWGAQRLEQLLTHPSLSTLGTFGHGEVSLVEVRVPAPWEGQTLDALYAEEAIQPAVVVRGGQALLPTQAHFVLHEGDLLVLAVSHQAMERLSDFFRHPQNAEASAKPQ